MVVWREQGRTLRSASAEHGSVRFSTETDSPVREACSALRVAVRKRMMRQSAGTYECRRREATDVSDWVIGSSVLAGGEVQGNASLEAGGEEDDIARNERARWDGRCRGTIADAGGRMGLHEGESVEGALGIGFLPDAYSGVDKQDEHDDEGLDVLVEGGGLIGVECKCERHRRSDQQHLFITIHRKSFPLA